VAGAHQVTSLLLCDLGVTVQGVGELGTTTRGLFRPRQPKEPHCTDAGAPDNGPGEWYTRADACFRLSAGVEQVPHLSSSPVFKCALSLQEVDELGTTTRHLLCGERLKGPHSKRGFRVRKNAGAPDNEQGEWCTRAVAISACLLV